MNIIGELSAVFLLSQIGFVVALIGIVLAIGGYPLLKVSFIPIAFLLFAIPLPYFIDAILTLRLQLISSELGVFFIRLFGIPVYLDGNIIDMGTYKLQVVEACSGLRYLYPLLSLSFLAAYLFHAPMWQRMLVFLSSIPIAIAMNGFRIGSGRRSWSISGATRWPRGRSTSSKAGSSSSPVPPSWRPRCICWLCCQANACSTFSIFRGLQRKIPPAFKSQSLSASPLFACLVLLCAGGAAVYSVSGRTEQIQDRTRFVEFPDHLGQWHGQPGQLDLATEQALGFDDYLLSDYARPDGKMVNLYVAYYASQRKGESPHSPIVCIPGGGWAITNLQAD